MTSTSGAPDAKPGSGARVLATGNPASEPASPAPSTPHLNSAGSKEDLTALLTRAVADAHLLFTREHHQARSNPYRLSISGLSICTREAAYRLAGTRPSDPKRPLTQKRRANIGTWTHEGFLPLLARVLGVDPDTSVEVEVELSAGADRIRGRADLIWRNVLIDLKTAHDSALNRVKSDDAAFWRHRVQVGAYALAADQAGHRIDWVAWIYVDRESGDAHVVVEPFDQQFKLMVLHRVWAIQRHAQSPDEAPREGPLVACQECAWHLRCLGEPVPPVPTRTPAPVYVDARTEKWLRKYDELTAQETELRKAKEFARFVVERSNRPGVYGGLEWGVTTPRGMTDDKDAAVKLLRELGEEVPQRPKQGRFFVKAADTPSGHEPEDETRR